MRSFVCPSCGAPLDAAGERRTIHCQFCNRDFERDELSGRAETPPKRAGMSPTMLGVVLGIPLAVGAFFLVLRRPKVDDPKAITPIATKPTVAPTPVPPPKATPPTPPPTPSAEVAPLDLEPGPFTMTWSGKVKSSMDPEPRVGAPCTLTGSFSSKPLGNAHCDHLVLQCAGKVYYDSAMKLEGMSSYSFHLGEDPVAGEVRAYQYGIVLKDVGSRSGERGQITLDTYKEMLEAFRDDAPSYRIKVTIDKLSPIRRGRPMLARTLPPFEEVVTRTAKVVSKTGTPPFSVTSCTMKISPALATKSTCRVTLTCGGKVVYGAGTTGYAECLLANGATGAPQSFVDPYPTPQGGDPEFQANLAAKTAVLSDTTEAGVTYSVSFTLE
jgi:hypothetical protein